MGLCWQRRHVGPVWTGTRLTGAFKSWAGRKNAQLRNPLVNGRGVSENTFLYKTACEKCGSSDANAIYSDGGSYCFSCSTASKGDGETRQRVTEEQKAWEPLQGRYEALKTRGIDKETCEAWGYQVGEFSDKPCHIANYRDAQGKLVCQKVRLPGKDFPTLGQRKDKPLYGQWRYQSGKHLVITEGEIDALSVSQAVGLKWAVVSLPDGAQSAEKAIAKAYDWLNNFERIVLMLDMEDRKSVV